MFVNADPKMYCATRGATVAKFAQINITIFSKNVPNIK